ncbi:OLC1v1022513C1 [Oldenlandia corymbosa var. corymbosa]|uniref:OLC1v1022513C1 n=1 Tax=Oldenlandia corymbosa var. corymbosa TaxID=529605 RepID=A0AAV1BY04_OLDCO|nr:OLC1v1022513C1 [Oldenlandia corymbosa var. corymbosa]
MAGKRSRPSSRPSDVLGRIRELTLSILTNITNGQSAVVYINKFQNYCSEASGNCCCNYDVSIGKEVLTLQKESHVRRVDILLRVLLIVQQLLQENRHGSKRDIYYMHPSIFKDQSVVDKAINDICVLLHCSRHNLNVVSVGNGLVMGWLRFSEAGRKFDCINSPNTVTTRVEI